MTASRRLIVQPQVYGTGGRTRARETGLSATEAAQLELRAADFAHRECRKTLFNITIERIERFMTPVTRSARLRSIEQEVEAKIFFDERISRWLNCRLRTSTRDHGNRVSSDWKIPTKTAEFNREDTRVFVFRVDVADHNGVTSNCRACDIGRVAS